MNSLQVTREGVTFRGSAAELTRLKNHFKRHHFVRLKQFVEPSLLKEIRAEIKTSQFFKKVHKDIAVELCAKDGPALRILKFVSCDRDLFGWIQKITGCSEIGCFTGRIYRMCPGAHHDDWHNDMTENRMVAMSVNLSEKVYQGGHLILRKVGEPKTEQVIPNTGAGDAILFHLSYALEHRVQNVRGGHPKTAYAGWFRSQPDFFAQIKKLAKRKKKKMTRE